MAIGDIIVGVDIGTSKICAVVGMVNNFGQIENICNVSEDCECLQKGEIVDEELVSHAISKCVKMAEDQTNMHINSAYVTIPGKYITIVQNSITKEVKEKYAGISVREVQCAMTQLKDIDIQEKHTFIDIIIDNIYLEDGSKTQDPIGCMSGSFTMSAQVILAEKEYVKKINTLFKKAGLDVDGVVAETIAQRKIILDTNEFLENVMIIDIGAGSTEIGVFEGNKFVYTNTIALGGNNITSDISYVLKVDKAEAERLKKQYGLALKYYIDNDNDITINRFEGINTSVTIKSSELIEIIEARIEEIFQMINKDLEQNNCKRRINKVILTGDGIIHINKSDISGEINLNTPVKMATGRAAVITQSKYRVGYSIVAYVAARPFAKTVSSNVVEVNDRRIVKKIVEKVKDFFYS